MGDKTYKMVTGRLSPAKDISAAALAIMKMRRAQGRGTSVEPDRKGRWGWKVAVDQDVAEATCPQCFRRYSDYETTAVVPCWSCRYEKDLDSYGDITQEVDDAPASALLRVSVEEARRFEEYQNRMAVERAKDDLLNTIRRCLLGGGDPSKDSRVREQRRRCQYYINYNAASPAYRREMSFYENWKPVKKTDEAYSIDLPDIEKRRLRILSQTNTEEVKKAANQVRLEEQRKAQAEKKKEKKESDRRTAKMVKRRADEAYQRLQALKLSEDHKFRSVLAAVVLIHKPHEAKLYQAALGVWAVEAEHGQKLDTEASRTSFRYALMGMCDRISNRIRTLFEIDAFIAANLPDDEVQVPNWYLCLGCKTRFRFTLPASNPYLIDALLEFAELHTVCVQDEDKHQKNIELVRSNRPAALPPVVR